MKKISSLLFSFIILALLTIAGECSQTTYNIVPKAPKVSPSLKPIIEKYRDGNYTGAMIDLESLVKIEKNNTYAKYYLALCYTRLGYKTEAETLYKEVSAKDDNLALTYYSQRALTCLDEPNSEKCSPQKEKVKSTDPELDDITLFIQSGRQIHPAAMDRITKQREEIRLQKIEYDRKTQQNNNINNNEELKSDASAPTKEEIISALDALSKIGYNPYSESDILAQAAQYNQYNLLNDFFGNQKTNTSNGFYTNNISPEIAQILLYGQTRQNWNSLINYGI